MFYLIFYVGLMILRLVKADVFYFPALLTLFLVSGFRFEVGCDWTGYLNQFNVYGYGSLTDTFAVEEPLWKSLFIFQNWLELPYPWINVFSSAIFFIGVNFLAQRQPDKLGFLILLFPILIINMPMSGIRQGAAIGVISMAFVAFIEMRVVLFVSLTMLATALHSSAIIFLLLVPFVRGAYSKTRIFFASILVIPGILAITSFRSSEIAEVRYVGSSIDAAGAVFRVGLLAATASLFFLGVRKKWLELYPDEYKIVTISSFIMLTLMAVLPFSSVIPDRIGYYFIPIQAMVLARIPFIPFLKNRRVLTAMPYLALLFVFAIWTALSRLFPLCYLPYRTWLFGFPDSKYFLSY